MRVLIVDDEAGARAKVKRFLAAHETCVLVGEAESGTEAVTKIRTSRPDLVFLDINMPGQNGFEALAALEDAEFPLVIFATAYDDRAIEAFEVNAVDYLLKPFDRARFDQALARARERLKNNDHTDVRTTLNALLGKTWPDRLMVQDAGHIKIVTVAEIDYVESAANYILLHCGPKQHIMRSSLTALLERLDPRVFCRVHRQYVINVAALQHLTPYARGDMILHLRTGAEIKLSRRYKDDLLQLMS